MEAALSLIILSSLLIGVYCNCNLEECRKEVRDILSSSHFCNSTKNQEDAVKALRKCVYWEDDKKAACPEEVRANSPLLAHEIQAKIDTCTPHLREARATCDGSSAFLCIAGLGAFAFVGQLATVPDIATACTQVKPLLTTLDVCKSCIGNLIGDPWTAVQADVESVWGSVTSLLHGACDCASRIEEVYKFIDRNSTCRTIESASQAAEDIAQKCVVDLVESFQTFDWLTIANNYIQTIAVYTNNICLFFGSSTASTEVLSLTTFVMALFTHFLILTRH